MIRTFMRATFPMLINVLFVLSLLGAIIGAWALASGWGGFSFVRFLMSLVLGISGVILLFGSIYVLLDIRDTLLEMKE